MPPPFTQGRLMAKPVTGRAMPENEPPVLRGDFYLLKSFPIFSGGTACYLLEALAEVAGTLKAA